MRTRAPILSLALAAPLLAACGAAEEPPVSTLAPRFEDFRAGAFREPGSGVFIVNGDEALDSEEALRAYFARTQPGALLLHRPGGVDARWPAAQQRSLSYCVSTAFGANYATVVQALNQAAADWAAAAGVRFVYRSDQDGSCNTSNNNVLFDVRPVTGMPYLARSFFPDAGRAGRSLLIDSTAYSPGSGWTFLGILRHELGHTLGFRHEHIRPEAGPCLSESTDWRPLSPYDPGSIMGYPWCGGSTSTQGLTQRDRDSASWVYGAARWTEVPGGGLTDARVTLVEYNGRQHLFVKGLDGRHYVNVQSGASGGLWTGWTVVPGGGTTNAAQTAAVYGGRLYLFAKGGGDGRHYVNVLNGSSWSGWSEVPGGGTTDVAQAAAAYNGQLYLFAKGGGDGRHYVNVLGGAGWSGWREVPGGGTTNAPQAAAAFAGRLYLFAKGGVDGRHYVNVLSGASWSGWALVPGGGTTNVAQAAAASVSKLYLIAKGGVDGRVYRNSYDGATWSGWSEMPGGGVTDVPLGAGSYNQPAYVALKGLDQRIYTSVAQD